MHKRLIFYEKLNQNKTPEENFSQMQFYTQFVTGIPNTKRHVIQSD